MTRISICFLGTGKINEKHIRIVKRLCRDIPIAIASRDGDRAKRFKERLGLKASFGNYASAIESDYSTLVIGVPPRLHFDLVEAALQTKKHLLIEKPVFSSIEQFRTLWPCIMNHPGVVMVAENTFFDPFHRKLKRVLRENEMGKPLYLELTRLGSNRNRGWREDPSEMPLGALHEGGVHWIRRLLDLASVFEVDNSGGALGVMAFCPPKPLTNTPGEDTSFVVARHRSGLVSRLLHSWAIPRRFTLFEMSKFILERGAVYFDSRGYLGVMYGKRKRFLWPCLRGYGGYWSMWRSYLSCLENGEKPELSLANIYHDFAYMDAAYRSMRSKKEEIPEAVPETPNNPSC
jgi:predicted dehydrogenase